MIPGLADASFVRLGQVHRNCYINAPSVLNSDLQARKRPGVFFAGQISGVEGYTESAATGLLCGINAVRFATGRPTVSLPETTMLGALCHYISHTNPEQYQPTNAAFGLLPQIPTRARRRRERRLARSAAALEALDGWIAQQGERIALEGIG
jgi:methylenetetrahydrofolate--tRNA-(uracil-5-)-methyltransferase